MKLFVLTIGLLACSTAYAQQQQQQQSQSYETNEAALNTQVAAGPVAPPKVHEIHTTSEREVIRVEEYKRPRQVIRIHESPAPPPQIYQVQAPPEPQQVIRVIQRPRPTRVQFTQTGPEVQVVNIPIRQVQQVYQPTIAAAPVQSTVVAAAPVVTRQVVAAAPIQSTVVAAAPVVTRQVVAAAPIQTTFSSPIVARSVSLNAQPVSSSVQTFTATPVSAPSFSYSGPQSIQSSSINSVYSNGANNRYYTRRA